VNTLNTAQKT